MELNGLSGEIGFIPRKPTGESMASCPYCGAALDVEARRCRKCGSTIEPQVSGSPPTVTQPPVQVIIQTGAPTVAPREPYPLVPDAGKSRLAAGLLGIFLGVFGVHRFYLGYVKIGAIQLGLTLVLGSLLRSVGSIVVLMVGIWGFVEGIMILTGSIDRAAKGRPLTD